MLLVNMDRSKHNLLRVRDPFCAEQLLLDSASVSQQSQKQHVIESRKGPALHLCLCA